MQRLSLTLTLVFASLALPIVAQQSGTDAKMPPPSPEVAAASRIPLVTVRVTGPDGQPLGQPVSVNWRSLTTGLSGGGATTPDGQFTLTPRLQGSVATGWQITPVGPHRLEIARSGFKSHVIESLDLQAGTTQRISVTLEPRGPRVLLEPDVYVRRAAEFVLKSMSGERDATGQVKVIGGAALLPDVARALNLEPARCPDAYVLTTIYVDGKFQQPVMVWFADGRPDLRPSYPRPDSFMPLEEREWAQMAAALDPFYAAAADVRQGAERFDSYLPDNMRQMLDLRGEKNRMFLTPEAVQSLSNDQLRRFVALTFDYMTLAAWLLVHDLQPPATGFRPVDVRRDPVAAIATLEAATSDMRRTLEAAGALSAERVAATQMYVRRMLGEGYMVREDPDRDGVRNLRRGARMYTVMLGAPLPHFIVDKGKLRIVAVDFF